VSTDSPTADVLLVSTLPVRERMRALNGSTLPAWADITEVSDVELKEAETLYLVTANGEHGLRTEVENRARGMGKTNAHIRVQQIERMEAEVTHRRRLAEAKQREDDERALRWKRAVRTADETLAAEDAATSTSPDIVRFDVEAELEMPEQEWVVEGLVHVGGRVVIGGFRKAGKSVMALNMAASEVMGIPFLDRFPTRMPPEDKTVGWLNCELTRVVARRWIKALDTWVPEYALRRIVGVHLRGAMSTFAVTTRAGEEALYRFLVEHRVETLIVDPVGPLMNVCGLDVNDGRDVGRFLTTMDRIADRAETQQLIYTAHIGKSSSRDEGFETVVGAGRWEDAADSIIILGKERLSGARWIRAEGREVSLDNATLVYNDETKKLSIDMATSRYEAELLEAAKQVLGVVRASPGILAGPLAGDMRIVGTKGKRLAAIQKAIDLGWIEVHAGHGTGKAHHALV
jgi:hypothetical protein